MPSSNSNEAAATPRVRILDLAMAIGFGALIATPLAVGLARGSMIQLDPRGESVQPGRGIVHHFEKGFPLRSQLVASHNLALARLPGSVVSDQVLIGRDGWLYITDNETIDDYLGLRTLSEPELEEIRLTLEARRDWLAQQGARYVLMPTPAKWEIHPEGMPANLVRGAEPSRLDQVCEWIGAHSDIELANVRPALHAARQQFQLFYKLDTHWNQIGAFFAARALIAHVATLHPGTPVPEFEEFELVPERVEVEGLARMLMLDELLHEDSLTPQLRRQTVPPHVERIGTGEQWNGVSWTRDPAAAQLKVLMIHDSFGTALVRHVAHSFRHVTFLFTTTLDPETVRQLQPDLVIQQSGQRHLVENLLRSSPGFTNSGEPRVADPGVEIPAPRAE